VAELLDLLSSALAAACRTATADSSIHSPVKHGAAPPIIPPSPVPSAAGKTGQGGEAAGASEAAADSVSALVVADHWPAPVVVRYVCETLELCAPLVRVKESAIVLAMVISGNGLVRFI
jgi:hypothetical protein